MTFALVASRSSPGWRASVTYQCSTAACGMLAFGSTEGHCIRNCSRNLKWTECNYPTWNLAKVSRLNITTHLRSLSRPPVVRNLNFIVPVKFMGQQFSTFPPKRTLFSWPWCFQCGFDCCCWNQDTHCPWRLFYLLVLFPKDAFLSTNMFSWPHNSIGWHFGHFLGE